MNIRRKKKIQKSIVIQIMNLFQIIPEVFPSSPGENTTVRPLFCKFAFSKLGYENAKLFKL